MESNQRRITITYSIRRLREASDEELIDRHDDLAKKTIAGARYYLEELSRRDQERATNAMLGFTRTISRLTWAILGLTLVNVAVATTILILE